MLTFTVDGDPKPQGSKRGFVTKTGRVAMVEQAGKPLKDWRENIAYTARAARIASHWEPYADGAVKVEIVFRMKRPLKPKFPVPAVRPDLDKLVRSVFDACTTAHIWTDDSQVTHLIARKEYGEPGITVTVWIKK